MSIHFGWDHTESDLLARAMTTGWPVVVSWTLCIYVVISINVTRQSRSVTHASKAEAEADEERTLFESQLPLRTGTIRYGAVTVRACGI